MLGSRKKVERFAAARPVFTRETFRRELFADGPLSSADSLLRYHVSTGRFRHVAPGVYAVVPAHLDPAGFLPDRLLVASMVRTDGVIGYHAALEVHGLAYSESDEIHVLSHGRPGIVETDVGVIRFVLPPASLRRNDLDRGGVVTMDRRGLDLPITGVERTIVDALERPSYAGGIEELAHALWTVEFVRTQVLVDLVMARGNRVLNAIAGWWLDARKDDLSIDPAQIDRLRGCIPTGMTAALGASPGDGTPEASWKVWLPDAIARPSFEGLQTGIMV